MQGASLKPLLDNTDAEIRDSVLIEEEYQADFIGHGKDLALRTLVTDTARLTIYYGLEQGELFNLVHDPLEMNNLFDRPEGVELKVEMMTKLLHDMIGHRDLSRYPV